jgi:hypothetical protein
MFIDRFVYIYIYMHIELIQTSSLFLGKSIPLSVSGNTLDRSPHRDTLLGKLTKNLEKDLKAQVLVTLYEEE